MSESWAKKAAAPPPTLTNKYNERDRVTLIEMGFDAMEVSDALDSMDGNLEAATALLLGESSGRNPSKSGPLKFVKKAVKSVHKVDIKDVHNKFMASYKTQKCREKVNHDKRMCVFWHTKSDRRRNPFELPYTCSECPNSSDTINCPDGDACLKAHNMLEKMFHPELFKISMCQRGPNGSHCERGGLCAFAHSAEDHRIPLSHSIKNAAAAAQAAADAKVAVSVVPVSPSSITSTAAVSPSTNNAVAPTKSSTSFAAIVAASSTAISNTILPPSQSDIMQPGKSMNDSKILDGIQEKLIKLVRSYGTDGVLSSELPKIFQDTYGERLDLADEAGEKFRIKDLLLMHSKISVVMYKGVQPKYMYDEADSSPRVEETVAVAGVEVAGSLSSNQKPTVAPAFTESTNHGGGDSAGAAAAVITGRKRGPASPSPGFSNDLPNNGINDSVSSETATTAQQNSRLAPYSNGAANESSAQYNSGQYVFTLSPSPSLKPFSGMQSFTDYNGDGRYDLGAGPPGFLNPTVPSGIIEGTPINNNNSNSSSTVSWIGNSYLTGGGGAGGMVYSSSSPLGIPRAPGPVYPPQLPLPPQQPPSSGSSEPPNAQAYPSSLLSMGGVAMGPGPSPTPVPPPGLPESTSSTSGASAMAEFYERLSQAHNLCEALRQQIAYLQAELSKSLRENDAISIQLSSTQLRLRKAEDALMYVESEKEKAVSQCQFMHRDLSSADEAIRMRDKDIAEKDQLLHERDARLSKVDAACNGMMQEIRQMNLNMAAMDKELHESMDRYSNNDRARQAAVHEAERLRYELNMSKQSLNNGEQHLRAHLQQAQTDLMASNHQRELLSNRVDKRLNEVKMKTVIEDELRKTVASSIASAEHTKALMQIEIDTLRSRLSANPSPTVPSYVLPAPSVGFTSSVVSIPDAAADRAFAEFTVYDMAAQVDSPNTEQSSPFSDVHREPVVVKKDLQHESTAKFHSPVAGSNDHENQVNGAYRSDEGLM